MNRAALLPSYRLRQVVTTERRPFWGTLFALEAGRVVEHGNQAESYQTIEQPCDSL
jgi:hypothetical protein